MGVAPLARTGGAHRARGPPAPEHSAMPGSCCGAGTARRSHRWRYPIPTAPPRTTLQRPIGLLDGDDKDFRTRLEVVLVSIDVSNNGGVRRDKDFLFSVLVFHRQGSAVDGGANLLDISVGHRA